MQKWFVVNEQPIRTYYTNYTDYTPYTRYTANPENSTGNEIPARLIRHIYK